MRLTLVLGLYALGTLLGFRQFAFASALFIWNDIFQPLSFAKAHGLLPVAHYVFAVLVASWLFHLARGKLKPKAGIFVWSVGFFFLWILFTAAVSPYRESAFTEYVRYLKYIGPLLLIYSGVDTLKDVKILTAALAASVGLWASQAGLHCLISGPNIHIGIPGGQMTERNDLTAGAVGTIPVLVYFAFCYDWKFKKAVRIVCVAAAILCVCAIFLSLSRGSSLGFFVSLVFYISMVSKKKLRDLFLLSAFVAVAFLLAPQSWYDRMATIELGREQTETSAQQRMEAMTGAFHATLDRPITGWGPAGWLNVAPIYTTMTANPHNIYLKLSSEVGIVGLLLYLGIMAMTYFRLMKTVKLARRHKDVDIMRLATALATCIMGLLCALSFLNAPLGEYLWSWVCVANSLPGVYMRTLAKRNADARRRKTAAAAAAAAASAAAGSAASEAAPSAEPDAAGPEPSRA